MYNKVVKYDRVMHTSLTMRLYAIHAIYFFGVCLVFCLSRKKNNVEGEFISQCNLEL